MSIVGRTLEGARGLLSGMGLTLGYLVRFDKVVTQQYPENRATLRMAERFRGKVELVRDPEKEGYRCTACGLCVKACPNNSLEVDRERDPETKKFRLTRYLYHFERCTLCGLCVDACNFGALRMGQDFENAVYDRTRLLLVLNTPSGVPEPAPPEAPAPATAPQE